MDSIGAIYSRASSHIFGDWNACGKVMGLAPWLNHKWIESDIVVKEMTTIKAQRIEENIIDGKIYDEGNECRINKSLMMKLPLVARNDQDLFDSKGKMVRRRYDFDDNKSREDLSETENSKETKAATKSRLPTKVALDAISLASRIQEDLETVVMDFVDHFKQKMKTNNLCLAGGVALNSILNGRLTRELGFRNVFIPPYPGDDGIALGCCAYGLFGNTASSNHDFSIMRPKIWSKPISPYLGPQPSEPEIKAAIEYAAPWLEYESVPDDQERFDIMAEEIDSGGVIAWFQGRSESGPRALGHRSIIGTFNGRTIRQISGTRLIFVHLIHILAPSLLFDTLIGSLNDDSPLIYTGLVFALMSSTITTLIFN